MAMNAAIRNMRLYPLTSAATRNALDKAFGLLEQALEGSDALVLAESEGRLLINEAVLDERSQAKPQIQAFLDMMLSLGLRNMTFKPGLDIEELTAFLKSVSTDAQNLREAGGLKEFLGDKRFAHILLDHKVYVAMKENEEVASKQDRSANLEETFGPMVDTLDQILESDHKGKVSQHLAEAMLKKEDRVLTAVLTRKMEGELGGQLFHEILHKMDDATFERLIARVRELHGAGGTGADLAEIKAAYQNMMRSEKGLQYQARVREQKEKERARKERERARLQAGLNRLLKGEQVLLKQPWIREALPDTVMQYHKTKPKVALALCGRLGEGLIHEKRSLRQAAASALLPLARKLSDPEYCPLAIQIGPYVSQWLSRCSQPFEGWDAVCRLVTGAARTLLTQRAFQQAAPLLEGLNRFYGQTEAQEPVRQHLGEDLSRIAAQELIQELMADFQGENEERRKRAMQRLTGLGAAAIQPLLERLKTSEDRSERSRLLGMIADIGPAARPALEAELELGKPWYYMRNLALLLGKVGEARHAAQLQPLLQYNDIRVQQEALNSIFRIGGDQREEILLAAFPEAGDRLKADIAGMLGAIKSQAAVEPLIEVLESRSLIGSKARDALEAKVCAALGQLRDPRAISPLTDLAEGKKGRLGKRAHSPKVQAAARKALAKIRES